MQFRLVVSSISSAVVVTTFVLFGLAACGKKDSSTLPGADVSSQSGAAGTSGANKGANGNRASQAITVSTTVTSMETVPLLLEAQGSVIALDEVGVLPEKTGTIMQIHFKEGDDVKRGQLLFTLDDRDDTANVKRADANVSGSQAALEAAQRDLARTQDLAARNFVSPSALDTARDKVDAASATLAQNKAALDQAKVSLSYTAIRAPFDGRAGFINVRVGSLVTATATATPMVKITRMNPIGISFSLPEDDLATLLAAQRQGAVKVQVDLDAEHSVKGHISFIDSSVDRTSGTIAVKAELDNSERRVWPGQYVTVKIVAGVINDAVVLPSQAVINGPNGRLVYIIKDDHTVAAQPVSLQRIVDQKAVVKGIDAGVKVVLEGGQNLRPGSRVQEVKDNGAKNGRRSQSGPQATPLANDYSNKIAAKSRSTSTGSGGKRKRKDAGGDELTQQQQTQQRSSGAVGQ